MEPKELAHIMAKLRTRSPLTIRSILTVIEEALNDLGGVDAVVLELSGENTIYMTRWLGGINEEQLYAALGIERGHSCRLVVIDPEESSAPEGAESDRLYVTRIPLYDRKDFYGYLSLVRLDSHAVDDEAIPLLGEIVSSRILPHLPEGEAGSERRRDDSLKIELLEASRDELLMRSVLTRMMEISGAEFCAFYSEIDESRLSVMLDGRELSARVPQIREKLAAAYRMFANDSGGSDVCREKVYYKNRENNIAYLVGNSNIESYFLVPVTFGSRVRGVLFFGSVREDAFVRENISFFRNLADEGEERTPLVYRLSGDNGIMSRIVRQMPFGCAVLSPEGKILHANRQFASLLGMDGPLPESIEETSRVSQYNIAGIREEFGMLGRDLAERELESRESGGRQLSVSMARLEGLSRETGSIVVLRDISSSRAADRANKEMMATVAHELRTPMTALKNSLRIMLDARSRDMLEKGIETSVPEDADRRFLQTALRTVNRLDILVNGLLDTTGVRLSERRPVMEEVGLAGFIEETCTLFRKPMENKEIDFRISLWAGADRALFDRDMIQQVLQNLISNSLKHVPFEGKISIDISRATGIPGFGSLALVEREIGEPRCIDIGISDSGPGLGDDVVERINSHSPGDRGNPVQGLGLFIAGRLVRRHGGRMTAGRAAAGGSEIHVYLPADTITSNAVRALDGAEEKLEALLSKGSSPLVYAIRKDDERCWIDTASLWQVQPSVAPDPGTADEGGFSIWPVSPSLAIGIEPGAHAGDPLFFNGGRTGRLHLEGSDDTGRIEVGWAVYPAEGEDLTALVKTSIEKTNIESIALV